jgi:two-component system, cell cycle response regulator
MTNPEHSKMRVLIAEDDPVSRRLLQASLTKWGYEVNVCVDGLEAWEALQKEGAPRLAILDWMMPGMDGVEVCRRVRWRGGEPYVYILLLTAKTQKEDVVAGMDAGADDYVTKPFDAHELKVRLRAGQRIINLQNELIGAREALRVQATHDALTGLMNRSTIFETLHRELSRAERSSNALGLAMIDLDNFKNVNDAFGHQAGDLVLKETAQRMVHILRAYDQIGRYGGEEFLAVLPDCDLPSAASAAERLRSGLAGQPIVLDNHQSLVVTVSVGIFSTSENPQASLNELIRAADAALYRAKRKGRNRVEAGSVEETQQSASMNGRPGI